MSDYEHNIETKMGSERSFGIVFFVIFALIGFYPLLTDGVPRWWSLALAIVILLPALFKPHLLKLPNRLWFRLGLFLGAIVAPIIMALIYVFTIIPTGLFTRLRGKDLLRQKLDPTLESYWIERTDKMHSMKRQF